MTDTPDTPAPNGKQPSTILWKGYNEQLQLDMTIIHTGSDEKFIYNIVQLNVPNSDLQDAIIDTRWKKETIMSAIESGEFEEVVNNCYLNMQVESYRDTILAEKRRVN